LVALLAVTGGNVIWASSAVVTFGWAYLLWGASISTIWPMFGVANQLLGVIALAIGTTFILKRSAKRIYALVTFLPMLFMVATVFTAGVQNLLIIYLIPENPMPVSAALTVVMLALAGIVVVDSFAKWYRILRTPPGPSSQADVNFTEREPTQAPR
jgi:carbon starvation protein